MRFVLPTRRDFLPVASAVDRSLIPTNPEVTMKRLALAVLTILALGAGPQAMAADDDAPAAGQDTAAAPDTAAKEEATSEPAATETTSDTMPAPADGDSK
jgi:hypothetical protein